MSDLPRGLPVLTDGETIVAEFAPDRAAYWRGQAWLAVFAMGGGMLVLLAIGNPFVWTGAIGGLAAIGLRAWYLESEELAARWVLTEGRLLGPGGRKMQVSDIKTMRKLGSAVQLVTVTGDKHLMKFQPDTEATLARLRQAGAGRGA